jgi:arginine decarboxylase
MGLRDLCNAIHAEYAKNDIARLTTEMYLSDMEPVMKPADAYAAMTHWDVDRVPVDELEGRISAVLLTPYPPGIPLLVPGERVNATIVRFLKFAREFNARFPGFETDIHGLVKQKRADDNGGHVEYYLDCVRADHAARSQSGYAGFVERNGDRV